VGGCVHIIYKVRTIDERWNAAVDKVA